MKLFNSRTVQTRLSGAGPSRGPFPRAILAALVAVAFAFPLSALPALAESTLFVGTGAGAAPGCASPGFASVQAAVNAAVSGDAVYLCGATPFSEQVIVNKSIKLTGDPGASIKAPNPFPATPLASLPAAFAAHNLFTPQAVVIVWGSGVNATISGLTVQGLMPGNGGCAEQEFGILVIAGAAATLSDDRVLNIRDSNSSLFGCQFGIGIQVGRRHWPKADFSNFLVENFVGSATITGTSVTGYQKGGIVIDGPGSAGSVSRNTVTGAGPFGPMGRIIAQNGIEVLRGASGEVSNNTVSANQYSGPAGASSGGVLIFGGCGDPVTPNVAVNQNTLTDNDVGVFFFNALSDCVQAPTTKTNDVAVDNTISNSAVTNASGFGPGCGYQAGVSDVGNHDTINSNQISGRGYTPAQGDPVKGCSPPGTAVVLPIDTSGAIDPNVHNNMP
jgi:hypothetical protein